MIHSISYGQKWLKDGSTRKNIILLMRRDYDEIVFEANIKILKLSYMLLINCEL